MKCLTKVCTRGAAAQCKGLCMKCYSAAKKLVTEGKTTWDQLASIGMAEHGDVDEFTKEFKRRQHAEG